MKQPANILIVDDLEMNRNSLRDLVSLLGHTPILAEGGVTALGLLKNQDIDLVLLDIMMPEIDGYEVLSQIKDDPHLRHIPVIVISALDEMESVISCIKMGAEDYLTKPFNRILLKTRIAACLERKYWQDLEEQYRQQLEEYNLKLEERVREKTKELEEANQQLHRLNQAKNDALKLIYYEFHKPFEGLFGFFKRIFAHNKANQLLETIKHSISVTQIDPSKALFIGEIHILHDILESAIESTKTLAQSRRISIGDLPHCGGQSLEQPLLDFAPEMSNDDEAFQNVMPQSEIINLIIENDEQHLHQKELCTKALTELLKTAVKFSSQDSTIQLLCDSTQSEISLSIHANGRLIPEEELPEFFEAPSQNHQITPGRYPGLGPSVAKNIITLLGGTIQVENRDSKGISFIIKLQRQDLGN